jgi:hypothetical protein
VVVLKMPLYSLVSTPMPPVQVGFLISISMSAVSPTLIAVLAWLSS